jgi:hypothetical protein
MGLTLPSSLKMMLSKHDVLAVREPEVELPVLPLTLLAIDLELDALGLGYIDGLDFGPVFAPLPDHRGPEWTAWA